MTDLAKPAPQRGIGKRRGNGSPRRRIETWIRIQLGLRNPKHRMVEKIEGFEPELKIKLFGDMRVLQCAEVEGDILRPA